MTDISREIGGQVSVPFKTSRSAPDDNTKRLIADKETKKGLEVKENIQSIQQLKPSISDKRRVAEEETAKRQSVEDSVKQAQPLKGRNIDVVT